ncbi:MAG: VOC family protein [Acidobacteriota bacterium]
MAIDVRGLSPLLAVFDMPTSIAFYCGTLGFEILKTSAPGEDFDWAWLRLGAAEVMLNTAYEKEERPEEPDPGRAASHSDVTIYFGCPDVDGTYALLRTRGVDVPPPVVQPYGMKQLTIVDPDGFRLCFQWTAS